MTSVHGPTVPFSVSSYASCFTQLHFLVIVHIICLFIFLFTRTCTKSSFRPAHLLAPLPVFTGLTLGLLPHFPRFRRDIRGFLGELLLVNVAYLHARPFTIF